MRGPHLVVLVGASGAGKSTWAARHFSPTEIVSTDRCRALVGDREEVQAYSKQAFELFYFLIEKRMELRKMIVADSTALDPGTRRSLLDLAHAHAYPAVAIVFPASLDVRRSRNAGRARQVPDDVLIAQQSAMERAVASMGHEGWDTVHVLSQGETKPASVVRLGAEVRSNLAPPYDIVGDVHGCHDELTELLARLVVVVSRHEQPFAFRMQPYPEAEAGRDVRATVGQVAKRDQGPTLWVTPTFPF